MFSNLFRYLDADPFLLSFHSGSVVKNPPASVGDAGDANWIPGSLDQEEFLEKEMEIHSSIRAWRIPWTGEPGKL